MKNATQVFVSKKKGASQIKLADTKRIHQQHYHMLVHRHSKKKSSN